MMACCTSEPHEKTCPHKDATCAHGHAHTHEHTADQRHNAGHALGNEQAPLHQQNAAASSLQNGVQTRLRILQMDCPTEEAMIRKKLAGMRDVGRLEFHLIQRILTVEHTPQGLHSVLRALHSLGFKAEVLPESGAAAQTVPASAEPQKPWWPMVLALAAALAAEAIHYWGGATPGAALASAVSALVAIAVCGLGTYRKGWLALRNGNFNINVLMSIAVTGALAIGQWPEAAMVMILFTLAERIEAKSLDRARHAIAGLMQLAPEKVSVQQSDGSWQVQAAQTVAVGSIARVKPGERIALDGVIVQGRSSINQAPITGESLPVDKSVGDSVFAGTINTASAFDYRVQAAAGQSMLARIIKVVEEAQSAKAPTQSFVDRFASFYTPSVMLSAVLVALLPPLALGEPWLDWIYKALVLLVIACPCALVISTPVTIVSGLAAAARQGILIKGGAYLEAGRKLRFLALDKTGTITHGKPVQTDFAVWAEQAPQRGDSTANPEAARRLHTLAASLAAQSDHPVSRAVAQSALQQGAVLAEVETFTALPGLGVRGRVAGVEYALGNHRMVHELGLCSAALEAHLDALERQGKTVVLLINAAQVLAVMAVADSVKDSSRAAIAALQALKIETIMLSGDNSHTVQAIAAQVGLDKAWGDQLPEDKLRQIEQLGAQGEVGMVGDGINDAPALARAHIGFAMGAMGSDTAIETADVALMDDDLRKIPTFVRLSQSTHAVLLQNISLALGIKAVFLVLTLMERGSMWMAVFADTGASLLVVGNGLRLLRKAR